MRYLLLATLFFFSALSSSQAQTLDSALKSLESDTEKLLSKNSSTTETWGQQTLNTDLRNFLSQTKTLSLALKGDDAGRIQSQQTGFSSAAARLKTSKVFSSPTDLEVIQKLMSEAEQLDKRLTDLRERFGGRAPSVSGDLGSLSLQDEPGDLGTYTNVQDLLIDVRCARQLVRSLPRGLFGRNGFGYNGLNNLDILQVNRVETAAWSFERSVSINLEDVRETYPDWLRFQREYNRMMYPGTGTGVRQLQRVMSRLETFYENYAPSK